MNPFGALTVPKASSERLSISFPTSSTKPWTATSTRSSACASSKPLEDGRQEAEARGRPAFDGRDLLGT